MNPYNRRIIPVVFLLRNSLLRFSNTVSQMLIGNDSEILTPIQKLILGYF